VFVACEADETIVRARLDARDATSESDARWNVYLVQRQERDGFASSEPVLSLDTGRALDVVREALLPRLWAWRQGRPIASTA
jgi:predicted kinase